MDNAGGGTIWLFTIIPGARIEAHDIHWCSEISLAISENKAEHMLKELANNYQSGVASSNPVWEYLTPSAKIIAVEEYQFSNTSNIIKIMNNLPIMRLSPCMIENKINLTMLEKYMA